MNTDFSQALWLATALFFIIEGLLPFAAPHLWKQMFKKMSEAPEQHIRFAGISAVVIGLVMLFILKRFVFHA
jgi:uncharacterized protein